MNQELSAVLTVLQTFAVCIPSLQIAETILRVVSRKLPLKKAVFSFLYEIFVIYVIARSEDAVEYFAGLYRSLKLFALRKILYPSAYILNLERQYKNEKSKLSRQHESQMLLLRDQYRRDMYLAGRRDYKVLEEIAEAEGATAEKEAAMKVPSEKTAIERALAEKTETHEGKFNGTRVMCFHLN